MDRDSASSSSSPMEQKSSMRSCMTCAKAKAKCVRQAGQEVCERCARLGKECYSRQPVVRRKGLAKTSRAAQLENLEHKIEHLVNALANSQAQKGYGDMRPTSPPTAPLPDRDRIGQNIVNSFCIEPQLPDAPNSAPTLSPNTSTCFPTTAEVTTPAALVPPTLTPAETEALLNRYRTLMASNMPFVILPSSDRELDSKPVLLQAILTVAHFHDYPKQQAMVKRLIRDISERTLVNGEKSLDIVQAILVLIAWFYSHVWSNPQMSNLLHLAQAMIGDLNLDRSPQACPGHIKHGVAKPGHPPPRLHATLEEHRTVAGVVFFVNMLFSNFKKITPIRRFRYLTEVLDALQQAREYPSDALLVQMLRLQFLADDSCLIDAPNAPVDIYMKAFKNDLEQLRGQYDPCVEQIDIFLQLQYLSVEICILEMSLNDVLEGRASVSTNLDNLWRCFDACKTFADIFFGIPASTYLVLPFHHFATFAHSFIVLIKLATLEGWSTRENLAQISFIIEETASRYESSATCGPEGVAINNDSFSRWATRVRFMRQVYEGADGPASTPAQQQPTPPDDIFTGEEVFFNYDFWQSFGGTDGLDLGLSEIAMT